MTEKFLLTWFDKQIDDRDTHICESKEILEETKKQLSKDPQISDFKIYKLIEME